MLASDRILLANLWGICTSLSRKTATNATVTTIKNSNNEKTIVAVQRKTEELVFGIKNFLKNFFNICIFSFKYSYLTYYNVNA